MSGAPSTNADAPLMLSVSGCRGIVGASLTPQVLERYAGALAGWFRDRTRVPRPTLVLACDGRRGGAALKDIVASALTASACDVIDIGIATTPTVGVMVNHLGAQGGVTLTASHNPGEWNGVKAIDPTGAAPAAREANEIVERFKSGRASPADGPRGSVTRDPTAADVHVRRALEALARVLPLDQIRARRFRVVVDSVNASGTAVASKLLTALGCDLVHLHNNASGDFPHTPEPTEENLRGLCASVREHGAAAGFAQDPDADRLAVIDADGRYIGEEYTLVLACRSLLASMGARANGAALAANLSTSRMIDDVAASFGARVIRAAVGEANVVEAMRRERAVIGGEGNGGVIWPEVSWIRDSIGAMGLVLALMTRENATIADLVKQTPAYAIEKRKTPVREGLAQRAVEGVRRAYQGRPGARLDSQDGCRADFPVEGGHAWLHVRASNTEPIVRFIAEAPTRAQAAAILDEAERLVGDS